ncbi:MAG: T9SS type A sorting domain-containing protein, partial [Candidatus Marinimicrobia bacterium]|nr:T9SS type A sorting domain-containing protein [Candidatus Neomarinimicrobiota bacterium]
IYTDVKRADLNEKIVFACAAKDPDDHPLSFTWSCQFGAIDGADSSAVWAAPAIPGYYYIGCTVDDEYGGQATDSTAVIVLNFSDIGTGFPIAYYPFDGNADDASGFDLDGLLYGATLVDDRFGDKNKACYFDGVDDFISVRNHNLLNFTQEISVNFWMNVAEFLTVEMHPISHGNWENRWKVSLTPNSRTLRWTIKTDDGIKDLDSNVQMAIDSYCNITCLYDGAVVKIYINGELDSQSNHSGKLLTTDIDLTIGRVLPFNTSYNFKGILDDIRIYSYALSEEEIDNIYAGDTRMQNTHSPRYPDCTALLQNYPNPFNGGTTIKYQIKEAGLVQIAVFDVLGRKVRIVENDEKQSGYYSVIWDGKNDRGDNLATGVYFFEMKINSFYDRHKLLLLK